MDGIQVIYDVFDLITAVIKRPVMFDVCNVEDLQLFLRGYMFGGGKKADEFMSNFRDFVNNEFSDDFTSKVDHDWARLIRLFSAGDKHSLELFENLFEKFKLLKID